MVLTVQLEVWGRGLPIATGMAFAKKNLKKKVYVSLVMENVKKEQLEVVTYSNKA